MIYEKLHLRDYYEFLGENDRDATLEIYLPDNLSEMDWQDKKRPCMLICPGGAYAYCSKREAEPVALEFLPEGFNCFVLTYSTKPHSFPSQLLEVAAVMELIYKNTDKWHCDTEKIAILGFSAGGHLAAFYSNMFDCKEVREFFPESKSVNASVLCYPVITGDFDYTHRDSIINVTGHEPSKEDKEFFSCEKRVSEKTPPAFIWHTSEDASVNVNNSLFYAQALSKYKIPFEMHIYPFGRHGLSTANEQTNTSLSKQDKRTQDWVVAAKKWLKVMFDL